MCPESIIRSEALTESQESPAEPRVDHAQIWTVADEIQEDKRKDWVVPSTKVAVTVADPVSSSKSQGGGGGLRSGYGCVVPSI